MGNCNACGKTLERPYLRIEFAGKPGSALDGTTFYTCAGCISLRLPPSTSEPLPPRISDPVAEPEPDAAHDCVAA